MPISEYNELIDSANKEYNKEIISRLSSQENKLKLEYFKKEEDKIKEKMQNFKNDGRPVFCETRLLELL